MFEVGFTEILLILGLALLVLGPEKLPKLAAQIGRWSGRAKSMARQLRAQLDQEVNFQEQRATHGKGETPAEKPQPDAETPAPSTNAAVEPAPAAKVEYSGLHEGNLPANDPVLKPSNE